MNLAEIDKDVTMADTKKISEEDLLILNVHRTGSSWNRSAAYWAGQCNDQRCPLCMDNEEYDHIFTCKALEAERVKADPQLAMIDSGQLHSSIKCGIAPALKADPRKPFWGGDG